MVFSCCLNVAPWTELAKVTIEGQVDAVHERRIRDSYVEDTGEAALQSIDAVSQLACGSRYFSW